jgi:hypothetical protein
LTMVVTIKQAKRILGVLHDAAGTGLLTNSSLVYCQSDETYVVSAIRKSREANGRGIKVDNNVTGWGIRQGIHLF